MIAFLAMTMTYPMSQTLGQRMCFFILLKIAVIDSTRMSREPTKTFTKRSPGTRDFGYFPPLIPGTTSIPVAKSAVCLLALLISHSCGSLGGSIL